MNRFEVIGNLTRDVEIRTTQNNKEVAIFTIAVSRTFKNKDGNYDTDFFDFTMWNPSDFYKDNLKKGKKVYVQSRVQKSKYEKDNKTQYSVELLVEHIEMLSKVESQSSQVSEQVSSQVEIPNVKSNYDEDSDIQLLESELPF